MDLSRIDLGLVEEDGFIAWALMFHMVSIEHALHVLGMGGKVFVIDGADPERIAELVAAEPQWWLVLIPGMIEPLIEEMKRKRTSPKGVRLVGCLADLIPPQTVAEASRLLGAPYWNTFGSTETGMLPAAGTRFGIGEVPADLSTYKCPREIRILKSQDEFPRSTSGKVQRQFVEQWS